MAQTKELIAKMLFALAAAISVAAVLVICIFIFGNGIPAIAEIGLSEFLFGTSWKPSSEVFGIGVMVVGSLYVMAGALVIGVPLGILCAVFLACFGSERVSRVAKSGVQLLAGIPSVVYGFFGLVVLVPFIRDNIGGTGQSILCASVVLGIMILPTIITLSESALRAVPDSYYEGALALGADHERSVMRVVLPAAVSGILASIILAIGRAIGETMAVIMIAGNQVKMPSAITDGVRTMTANIVLEMGYAADLHRGALIGTACVLFVFILIINFAFSALKKRGANG
jgi:phosphate transport system permease protein